MSVTIVDASAPFLSNFDAIASEGNQGQSSCSIHRVIMLGRWEREIVNLCYRELPREIVSVAWEDCANVAIHRGRLRCMSVIIISSTQKIAIVDTLWFLHFLKTTTKHTKYKVSIHSTIVTMPGAPDTVLNLLAAMKAKYNVDEMEKSKIAELAKIKGASTMRKAIAKLKKEGRIEVDAGGMIKITSIGMDRADRSAFDSITIPTTNEEKHERVKEEILTSENQRRVFDALADGHIHIKEDVRQELGMPNNSTWRKLLASLVKINVAEYPDGLKSTTIRLTSAMFPIVPRPEE